MNTINIQDAQIAVEVEIKPTGASPIVMKVCEVTGFSCFAGHGEADKMIRVIMTSPSRRYSRPLSLRSYCCDHCKKWHLTSDREPVSRSHMKKKTPKAAKKRSGAESMADYRRGIFDDE